MNQIVDYQANIANHKSRINIPESLKNSFKNIKWPKFPNLKIGKITLSKKRILLVGAVLVFLVATVVVFKSRQNSGQPLIAGATQTDFSPQTQTQVNRRFEIPIRNESGKDTGDKLIVALTTIDHSKRILIQGKPATARDTKAFLILNLEIENSTTNQLTVRPVDFVRLVDDQNRSFAPDVHNNEVTAEPVSIKKTRVGFVVDENQKNFKFLFGEVSGEKQTVEITI